MECSCSISASVDDYVEVIWEGWLVARKDHKCHECSHQIQPREYYHKETVKDDGGIRGVRLCGDCKSIRDHLVGDFIYGEVREMVEDAIVDCDGQIPEKCIARLTPAARAWVCEEIDKCWDDADDDEELTAA